MKTTANTNKQSEQTSQRIDMVGVVLAIEPGGKAAMQMSHLGRTASFLVYYDEQQARGDHGGLVEGFVTGDYEVWLTRNLEDQNPSRNLLRQHVSPGQPMGQQRVYAAERCVKAMKNHLFSLPYPTEEEETEIIGLRQQRGAKGSNQELLRALEKATATFEESLGEAVITPESPLNTYYAAIISGKRENPSDGINRVMLDAVKQLDATWSGDQTANLPPGSPVALVRQALWQAEQAIQDGVPVAHTPTPFRAFQVRQEQDKSWSILYNEDRKDHTLVHASPETFATQLEAVKLANGMEILGAAPNLTTWVVVDKH